MNCGFALFDLLCKAVARTAAFVAFLMQVFLLPGEACLTASFRNAHEYKGVLSKRKWHRGMSVVLSQPFRWVNNAQMGKVVSTV